MMYLTEAMCNNLKPGDKIIYTKTNPYVSEESRGCNYPKEGELVTVRKIHRDASTIWLEEYVREGNLSTREYAGAGYSYKRFAQPAAIRQPKNYTKPMTRTNVPSSGVKT